MVDATMDPVVWLRKHLETADADLLREMLGTFIQALMGAEADALCGAPYGTRSPERVNTRHGYRSRPFDTRTGTLELALPKLRSGSYFLRLAPGAPPTRRAGPAGGDRGVLRAGRLDPAGGGPHRDPRHQPHQQEPRVRARPLAR